MTTVADAIKYLDASAALYEHSARQNATFCDLGVEDAEAALASDHAHAAVLRELAQAVKDLDAAARAVFTAKGRHHTQVAMCDLGDLLGIETTRP
jgi:hypothetical protein